MRPATLGVALLASALLLLPVAQARLNPELVDDSTVYVVAQDLDLGVACINDSPPPLMGDCCAGPLGGGIICGD